MKYLLFLILFSMPIVAMDYHKGALNRKPAPKQTDVNFYKSQAINQRKVEQQLQKSKFRRGAEACGWCCLNTTGCVVGTMLVSAALVGGFALSWQVQIAHIEARYQEIKRNKFIDEEMAKRAKQN